MMSEKEILDLTEKTISESSKHLDFLKSSIDLIQDINNLSKDVNIDIPLVETNEVSHFNSLITISLLEGAINLKNIIGSSVVIESKYYCKVGCLLIYEAFKTYDRYGKILISYARKHPQTEMLYKDLSKTIRNFRKEIKYEKEINEIRNKTIGHIDKDFSLFYSIHQRIDTSEIKELLVKFIILFSSLFEFSVKLMEISDNINLLDEDDELLRLRISKNMKRIKQNIDNLKSDNANE